MRLRGLVLAVAALVLGILTPAARAQLRPDRLYYGVNRAAPMTVEVPAGSAAGDVTLALLEAGTAKVLHRAPATAGSVDLAALFPALWKEQPRKVLYAQLMLGEQKLGPAVVIQPLLMPSYAPRVDGSGTPMFPPDPPGGRPYSGFRAYVDQNVVLETSKGDITLGLRPDVAPNTAWNFRHLVESGFYTDIIFHRIVARLPTGQPFVVQVGDPTGAGSGGPGYFLDLEPSSLGHGFGVISMARSGDPNSNGSQFFICLSREGTERLDGKYTTFAQTIAGAEVITALAQTPVGPQDRPLEPPVLKSARLVDAAPYGDGPKPVTEPAAPGAPER
ncbi:MAG TPA: peptidylprolyl isomerase [Phycisphaerales bacterium]|nr:peptidylprolyl isomerase [Phycisphaerales bacterium]